MSEPRHDHLDPDELNEFEESDEPGQVSEVQQLDPEAADAPLAPSDSTAGYPESESGTPDTRGSGPDAAPPENRRDNETT